MASLTAHQVAAWLRAHTPVQEMHINALLQQEADGDVLDLLNEADLQSMTGDGLTAAHCERMDQAKKRGHGHDRAQNGDERQQRGAASSHMRTTEHSGPAATGTRVTVISVTRGWAHVQLAGNRGWVAETDALLDAQAPVKHRAEASVNACQCTASMDEPVRRKAPAVQPCIDPVHRRLRQQA